MNKAQKGLDLQICWPSPGMPVSVNVKIPRNAIREAKRLLKSKDDLYEVLQIPLEPETLKFCDDDGNFVAFQALTAELSISRKRFVIKGAHPDSMYQWSTKTGWIDELIEA